MRYRRKLYRKEAKKQKIILIISLFTVLLCLMVGYSAFSTKVSLNVKGNIGTTPDICFKVSDNGDGTGTIIDYDKNCGTKVKIPSKINGLTITKIVSTEGYESDKSFNRKDISYLWLPDTLTYIGNFAFDGNKLTHIKIPDEVTYIGAHAFQNNSFISVTIPSTIKRIGNNIFSQNVALKTINIKRKEGTVGNAPWGATNATVNWAGTN